jgi:hypothetical protein
MPDDVKAREQRIWSVLVEAIGIVDKEHPKLKVGARPLSDGGEVDISSSEKQKAICLTLRVAKDGAIVIVAFTAGLGNINDADAAKKIANAIKGAIEKEFG